MKQTLGLTSQGSKLIVEADGKERTDKQEGKSSLQTNQKSKLPMINTKSMIKVSAKKVFHIECYINNTSNINYNKANVYLALTLHTHR